MSSRKFLGLSTEHHIDHPRESPVFVRVIFWSSLRLSGFVRSSHISHHTIFTTSSLRVVSHPCHHLVILFVTQSPAIPIISNSMYLTVICTRSSRSSQGSSVMSCRVVTRQLRVIIGVINQMSGLSKCLHHWYTGSSKFHHHGSSGLYKGHERQSHESKSCLRHHLLSVWLTKNFLMAKLPVLLNNTTNKIS